MHTIFISPTFYKNKIKMSIITLFAKENFCVVFSSMVTNISIRIY